MNPENGQYLVEVRDGRVVDYSPFQKGQGGEFNFVSAVVWVAVLIAGFILLYNNIFIVRQQSVGVIERLGRFNRLALPGLRFKIPLIERWAGELDIRIQELGEEVTVKSSDNAFVSVPVKIQYRIIEGKAKEAFYELAEAKKQIRSYIVNIVRSTAAQLDMNEVFKSKDKFEADVQADLNAKFGGFGFEIVNVLVDDPVPAKEVITAFNRVIASQREMEAAKNEAEAVRLRTVAVAQAEAESLVLKAKAYVEQRAAMVEGFKGILQGMSNEQILNWLVGIDWRDAFRDVAKKGTTLIVPSPFDGQQIGRFTAALNNEDKKVIDQQV